MKSSYNIDNGKVGCQSREQKSEKIGNIMDRDLAPREVDMKEMDSVHGTDISDNTAKEDKVSKTKVNPSRVQYRLSHNMLKYCTCDKCGEVFQSPSARLCHTEKAHAPKPKLPVECNICGQSFSKFNAFSAHMRRHKQECFPCYKCGRKFQIEIYRDKHASMCGEKKIKLKNIDCLVCETCGKTFKGKQGLWFHAKTHTDRKRSLQCSYCDKKFYNEQTKRTHEKSHTGERPKTCSICDKGFRFDSHVRRHEYIVHKKGPFKRHYLNIYGKYKTLKFEGLIQEEEGRMQSENQKSKETNQTDTNSTK